MVCFTFRSLAVPALVCAVATSEIDSGVRKQVRVRGNGLIAAQVETESRTTDSGMEVSTEWWQSGGKPEYCPKPGCPLPLIKSSFVEVERSHVPIPVSSDIFGSPSHCRLAAAMRKNRDHVVFSLAGGSASQGAGLLPHKGEKHWWNLLKQKMTDGSMSPKTPEFHNVAQGGTDSVWSALLSDSTIGDSDVLLWEYAINDVKGGTTGYLEETPLAMQQAMELWIIKAMQLKKKPALVFVYLYDQAHAKDGTYYSTALLHQRTVLERFISAGVDILVVPMKPALESVNASSDMRAGHHPGPAGHIAMADAVLKAIQNAVASDGNGGNGCSKAQSEGSVTQSQGLLESNQFLKLSPTLNQMLSMRSMSGIAVEPRFGKNRLSELACAGSECSDAPQGIWGKTSKGRDDRKFAWAVPTCAGNKRLVLKTTGDACKRAKFIGMRVGGGGCANNEWPNRVSIEINGQKAQILDQPKSLIGDIPFQAEFNMWLNIEEGDKGGCRQVSVCMPDANVVGTWNDKASSPFPDGGGRVDWATVFY